MRELLPAAAQGKPLEIWFQDEARVGQQGTLTRLWARRGSRPPAPRDQRHHWVYLFGAVGPARATGAALVLPSVNAELMNLRLAEISGCVAAGAHAVLVFDGAGWHQTGGRLVVPQNLTLMPLASYAPELNPVENVRELLRANLLSHRVWENYDDILEACRVAWNSLIQTPQRSASITTRSRENVSTVQAVGITRESGTRRL